MTPYGFSNFRSHFHIVAALDFPFSDDFSSDYRITVKFLSITTLLLFQDGNPTTVSVNRKWTVPIMVRIVFFL